MLESVAPDKLELVASTIRNGGYNLLLGSGVSLDSTNGDGHALLSGNALRQHLCSLTGVHPDTPLHQVYGILSSEQIQANIYERYRNCRPGATALETTAFLWRRIFTLNIDDSLNAAYETRGALQRPKFYTFRDDYEETRDKGTVPIVHLHGSVAKADDGFIFSIAEYMNIMRTINPWMVNLTNFLPVESFIIAGTSLNEVDLEYYLSHRSSSSQRSDRGVSFFVEPFADRITENRCERFGLTLYRGTFLELLRDLAQLVPNRPSALGLVQNSFKDIFPKDISPHDLLSIATDFELVPSAIPPSQGPSRFLNGHVPEWGDLAANRDVGRQITGPMVIGARRLLEVALHESRVLVLLDETGSGKSTILRRIAYTFAEQGFVVLMSSAASNLPPDITARSLDRVLGPLVIIVDDLADQVGRILELASQIRRRDVVIICAERAYRRRHIERALSSINPTYVAGARLQSLEARQLINLFVDAGLYPKPIDVVREANVLTRDEIAIAACRILGNFRPLDRIVDSLVDQSDLPSQKRYRVAALAQSCFRGGVAYDLLYSLENPTHWDDQIAGNHPLSLTFTNATSTDFVIPLNAVIANRVFERLSQIERLESFVSLARLIAPRVNRRTAYQRLPEPRLAARLFDYDRVVRRQLGTESLQFFVQTQDAWSWSSRYWEQLALYYLSQFRESVPHDLGYLDRAAAHARFALSLERHSLGLTTLGSILITRAAAEGVGAGSTQFDEALVVLKEAIEMERVRWSRISIHPFATLFRGVADYVRIGGTLSRRQIEQVRDAAGEAALKFGSDVEILDAIAEISIIL